MRKNWPRLRSFTFGMRLEARGIILLFGEYIFNTRESSILGELNVKFILFNNMLALPLAYFKNAQGLTKLTRVNDQAIRRTLEQVAVEFIDAEAEKGPGVRLRGAAA